MNITYDSSQTEEQQREWFEKFGKHAVYQGNVYADGHFWGLIYTRQAPGVIDAPASAYDLFTHANVITVVDDNEVINVDIYPENLNSQIRILVSLVKAPF